MKIIIEGHTVVVNKMSIYIDGKMEFQAVNMITEYGQKLNGCKYAVASRYSRERLEELYTENLKKFIPFIYLTEDEYKPIREANNNDSKFHQREINCHAGYEYQEEISESAHECVSVLADPEPDVLTRMVEIIDDAAFENRKQIMKMAINSLTETQRRRILASVYNGKTNCEIAREEGSDESSIRESIDSAEKKIKKYFKKYA